ncbi:MAG TPA: hypothetical protein VGM03_24305, partial [Phycisphaerae bacterium]
MRNASDSSRGIGQIGVWFRILAVVLAVSLLTAPAARAQNLLVSSVNTNSVIEYSWPSGAPLGAFVPAGSGGLSGPRILRYGANGNLFVPSYANSRLIQYDGATGALMGTFVAAGSGGLANPFGQAWAPSGNVLLSSQPAPFTSDCVSQYNGTTGAPLGNFVCLATTPCCGAINLAFRPNGNVLVSHLLQNEVREYTYPGGALVRIYSGGGLSGPEGVTIGPNGNLFVCSASNDRVIQFNTTTGAVIGDFVSAGSGGLDVPIDLAFGSNGNLFVSSALTNSVLQYNGTTGAFVGAFVTPGSGGLNGPSGIVFRPAPPPPPCPAPGSCTVVHATPGCDDESCCNTVCAADAFCCTDSWDAMCVNDALSLCAPILADFGDAPEAAACEGDPNNIVAPTTYPTLLGTPNAFPGRDAPYHFALLNPLADYQLGGPPDYEATAHQPVCDWLSPPPPNCDNDFDDGPIVLCLNAACTTGVAVVPPPTPFTCPPLNAIACFGDCPPVGAAVTGCWIFSTARGPFSNQPGFVNVAVDVSLSGCYGDAPTEWPMRDQSLAVPPLPWQVEFFKTPPFPVPTVYWVFNPITQQFDWGIKPFWTRFTLSDEQLVPVFTPGLWDGSGRAGGYQGGETEDWVTECDPSTA